MFATVAGALQPRPYGELRSSSPWSGEPPARAIIVRTVRKASQYVYVLVAEAFSYGRRRLGGGGAAFQLHSRGPGLPSSGRSRRRPLYSRKARAPHVLDRCADRPGAAFRARPRYSAGMVAAVQVARAQRLDRAIAEEQSHLAVDNVRFARRERSRLRPARQVSPACWEQLHLDAPANRRDLGACPQCAHPEP